LSRPTSKAVRPRSVDVYVARLEFDVCCTTVEGTDTGGTLELGADDGAAAEVYNVPASGLEADSFGA